MSAPGTPAPGQYAVRRERDTPSARADARSTLRLQGCLSVRYETNPDGTMTAHGYLRRLPEYEMT